MRKRSIFTFVIFLMVAIVAIYFQGGNWVSLYTSTLYHGHLSKSPANTSSGTAEGQFLQRYEERLSTVRQSCIHFTSQYNEKRISLRKWVDVPLEERPRLYISDNYKLLICNIPKCGSTQWRRLIATLENNYRDLTPDEYRQAWTKRLLWNAHDISTRQGYEEAERKVNEYFRILTVREPLDRLVSAYKSKLEILRHNDFGSISHRIHKKFGNGSDGLASFSEFVDFILTEDNPEKLDKHWKPYTINCDPCLFKFNIIAKLEMINQDFPYIANKLHFKRDTVFSDKQGKLNNRWQTNYHGYYKNLTRNKRLRIFEYYKPQYEYFGYPYPDYL